MNEIDWTEIQKFVINNLEITFIVLFCVVALFFLLVAAVNSGKSKQKENQTEYTQDIELEQLVQELKKASVNSRWLLEQYELRVRQKDDEMLLKMRRIAEIDEAIQNIKVNLDLLPDTPKGTVQKIRKLVQKTQADNLLKTKTYLVNPMRYVLLGILIGIAICLAGGLIIFWAMNIKFA